MKALLFSVVFSAIYCVSADAVDTFSLPQALSQAYGANPVIAVAQAKADAEDAAIRSESFLDNPKLGLMRESNMNFMQQQMGPMTTLSLSQEIKFPAKYFLMGSVQSAKARAAEQEAIQAKLEVRTKAISFYYGLFAIERIISLLGAQREQLREIARIAESRHSTGAAPQQDEMKAHVEQTQLERDILMAEEERSTMQGMLNAAVGKDATHDITLPKEELPVPRLSVPTNELPKLIVLHDKHIKVAQANVDEANALKNLARLSYAPDFGLSYRRAIGSYSSQNAYAAGIEVTIPLWFFMKQTSENSAASAKAIVAEKNLESIKLDHLAEVRSLAAKVHSNQKILEVYQTGLIPQATSTLESSRGSYRAGRSSFIELLDSERSLYSVRIAYYRTLALYTENLAKLEEIVGYSVSTLPQ